MKDANFEGVAVGSLTRVHEGEVGEAEQEAPRCTCSIEERSGTRANGGPHHSGYKPSDNPTNYVDEQGGANATNGGDVAGEAEKRREQEVKREKQSKTQSAKCHIEDVCDNVRRRNQGDAGETHDVTSKESK